MINRKVKNLKFQMIINNELQALLENEAKRSWILKKVSNQFLTFVKEEPQNIKYQIDFSTPTQEYLDILKQDGYEFVDNFKELSIYKNNNVLANDLQTDEITRLQALERIYTPKHLILLSILCLFLMMFLEFFRYLIFSQPLSWGYFFQNSDLWCLYFFFISLILLCVLNISVSFAIKHGIQYQLNHQTSNFRFAIVLEKIIHVISFIMILLSIYVVIDVFVNENWLDFFIRVLIIFAIITLFQYIINKWVYRIASESLQKVIKISAFIIYICAFTMMSDIHFVSQEKTMPSSYMTDATSQESYSNIFSTSYITSLENTEKIIKKEMYITCLNDFIAKEIMKANIMDYERETRMPTQEDIDRITEETGEWSSADIKYLSYDDAFQTYQRYATPLADECYYNGFVVIARKDHTMIISYLQDEDHYIDHVLSHYLK